jgi:hypothetical protein
MRRDLCAHPSIQCGPFLGGAARNRLDGEGARFAALFEIALDGGHGDLKGRGNLGLAMALIDCP